LRLVVGNLDRQHRVYPAGGYDDTSEGRALRDGYAALDIDTWPPATFVEPTKDLEYSRVNLRVRRFLGPCDDAPAWPLTTSPAIQVGERTCLDLDRETARPFTPVAPGGDNSISMRSGEACLEVMYRLVLPHEAACADGQPSACDF
jgi:hypothetical protein